MDIVIHPHGGAHKAEESDRIVIYAAFRRKGLRSWERLLTSIATVLIGTLAVSCSGGVFNPQSW
jgi:hypothetical protein